MNRTTFWDTWLILVSVLIAGFGIFVAFFNQSALFDLLFNRQVDPVFWPAGLPAEAQAFQAWAYGILGATVAGWGGVLALIAYDPFRRRERWAWMAYAAGLGLWYPLDTGLSLYHGVLFNAGFNTLLLLLAVAPLVFTRKEFLSNP